jgi:hypothetical protein
MPLVSTYHFACGLTLCHRSAGAGCGAIIVQTDTITAVGQSWQTAVTETFVLGTAPTTRAQAEAAPSFFPTTPRTVSRARRMSRVG